MMDIFFEEEYGKLYENLENGKCEIFNFSHPLGTVKHLFIKRKIPQTVQGENYFDIITPYGYGGPLITSCKTENKTQLIEEFHKAFYQYCQEHRIVSEFIRFHPILKNAEDFESCYKVKFMRNTVGTNLKDYEDPVQSEFSKSTRKSIRKALREGLECRITRKPDNLDTFKELYYATMKRIGADSFYYFDDSYFSRCLEFFGEHIVLVEAVYEEQVIGAELHFYYNNLIHTHLSGTLEDFHHLSPVYVMTFAIAEWGKKNGADLVHAGGGTTNNPDDSLYLFKKKFGQNTEFKFHIGQKVWNEAVYSELCEMAGAGTDEEFFPAYRSSSCTEKLVESAPQAL
ncbi:GNAT family N-acetyltransferase [Planomicrobium sp. CPCC 101079]|uniref:GNAT family N-acetyltransferase n=1 Tax=Planomicrobium sp. CPCC 101079 TaxID=2599618 RepID=UPI0011B54C59|nr:GNAT family N-acetyltransferase [Planomicrobium sp. CPCC 101079]TWT01917.1 GNAT family N-acetyltransferase [Planomicrobium sp. CPCC 101079]